MPDVNGKVPYICGLLTELDPPQQGRVKGFYERIADICAEVLGKRAFVPHEHYDPVKHASFAPQDVDAAERRQVCEQTSHLIVVPVAPSWGGGIEVEMAHRSGVPVVIVAERAKLDARKVSRLLLGNPAVSKVIAYESEDDALKQLRGTLGMDRAA